MKEYYSLIFDNQPLWDSVPPAAIDCFHWLPPDSGRPVSYARLCGVRGEGLFARLWSFEENPRCVNTKRDEPVYEDSCLEVFLKPFPSRPEYINFEMNCRGVCLSQFGKERNGRVFLKEICGIEPFAAPFETHDDKSWGVELFVPNELVSAVYGENFDAVPRVMKGNFYKCGDKTPNPHYASYFPVSSADLGFHNPGCFGDIILK